ncbi:Hsp20/alpha crystallin family protein [Rhodopirellula sp. P2]|uniref:Hsp20/alpha crystallin family protein n=1 Tax=Rhodopirellula sp. P2 TaxID=2127060 RepID=UPI002367C4E1|nr:Hsp20/alpha crystallin family protein [Rhodopirellula sp. P2]WDQ19564.1 Hsp20/alpha crystallin family protein [Rhodopirellula sp. P2]
MAGPNTRSKQRTENTSRGTTFTPRFDIWEGEQELTLLGDLPGVDPADLDVQFENRLLTIRGQVTRHAAPDSYLQSEYEVGDFQRSFTIGEKIDASGISAEMKNGVLTLHLPKSEEAKPRRIKVRAR